MSSKVDETASFRPAAACQRPAKGTQVSAGAPKYSLVTTLAAVALGVALADRVLLVWLPELLHGWLHEWLPDKPGDRWLQQEDSAVVYVVCLVLGYASFMVLRVPARTTQRPPVRHAKKAAGVARAPPRAGPPVPRKACYTGPADEAAARPPRSWTPAAAPGAADAHQDGQPRLALAAGAAPEGPEVPRLGKAAGWECDASSLNGVIRAFAKKGDLEGAWGWLQRMVAAGCTPNEQSYSLFVGAAIKAGDITEAEAWMERMDNARVEPTALSYMMMINGCARLSSVARAEHWLRRMAAAGFQPDIACYNSLIHACSSQYDVDLAERWFQEMAEQKIAPTVMTFTTLIDACAKSLDVKRAEKWMEAMMDEGISPNVVSFSTMINACAKVGDLARAEHWHDHMRERGVQPNAYCYSALINACARVGDVEAACLWLQRAESTGAAMDGVVYGCVINTCGKVGDAERAMSVFRQMQAQGIKSHIVVYAALARPFAYRGEWTEVERIREEMEGEGIAVNDYFLYTQILAYGRAKPRESDRAEAVFCDAVASGLRLNERLFKALGCAVGRSRCAQLSKLSRAEAVQLNKARGLAAGCRRPSRDGSGA